MRGAWTAVLLAAVAASGCIQGFQEVLLPRDQTTRVFTCAMLRDAPFGALRIEVHVQAGIEYSPAAPVGHLHEVLAAHTHKDRDAIEVHIEPYEDVREDDWTEEGWQRALRGHRFQVDDATMRLSVYWVRGLPHGDTGQVLQAGVIAIHHDRVRAAATALDWSTDDVARAVLLHWVGHAMGVVNMGVPMQQNHEGAPGHSSNRTSVMHEQWHRPSPGMLVANATYADYPADVLADWAAAAEDPRVCP